MSLFDLLWAPARAFLAIVERIDEAARRELEDTEVIQDKLLELQLLYELGDIEEAEYKATYEELMKRLQRLQEKAEESE